MMVLKLSPNCATIPHRLDLEELSAMMLWPDKIFERERAMQMAVAKYGRELICQGRLTAEQTREHAAIEAPSRAEILGAAGDRHYRAWLLAISCFVL